MFFSDNIKIHRNSFNLIIFDIDGVLIDTNMSYVFAVINSVSIVLSKLGINADHDYLINILKKIKEMPGFNNDWDCAEALLSFIVAEQIIPEVNIYDFLLAPQKFNEEFTFMKNNSLKSIRSVITKTEASYVRLLAKKMYAGDLCESLYDTDLNNCKYKGFYKNETTLVNTELLESIKIVKGIYTGRNSRELKLALKKIGSQKWNKPLLYFANDNNPNLIKPSPFPLLDACKKTSCSGLIYAGDSKDDFEAFKNFNQIKPNIISEFVLVNNTNKICNNKPEFTQVDNINQLLKFLINGENYEKKSNKKKNK